MNVHALVRTVLLALGLTTAAELSFAQAFVYRTADQIAAPGNVTQMVYSEQYRKLIVRNSGSALRIIDLDSRTVSAPILAQWNFSDIDLTPDGRYLYAADYGGENIGYGTPANVHRVLRIDLRNGFIESKATLAIAGRIEAVSAENFILSSLDQWISLTYNAWGTTGATQTLAGPHYASAYYGNIEYDASARRLLHGSSGSSSQELSAFRADSSGFFRQEASGTYGSAQGYGGTVVLSQDSGALYYGRLKVEALDLKSNLKTFPETIYAATGEVAFGGSFYYNAVTGAPIDAFGFTSTVFALGATSPNVWVFDDPTDTLRLLERRSLSRLARSLRLMGWPWVAPMRSEAGDPASALSNSYGIVTVTAVPEPRTWLTMAAGLALLAWKARRSSLGTPVVPHTRRRFSPPGAHRSPFLARYNKPLRTVETR